ncbi:MAG: asparagine synthase-related protein [archaeon]
MGVNHFVAGYGSLYSKIDSPDFEHGDFAILASNKAFTKGDITVFLFGRITNMTSSSIKLINFPHQEELILRLFKEEGTKFITRLDGYFLIMIIDKKELYVFNNRYSNTQCYFLRQNNSFILCDSYKPLLRFLDKKEMNMDVISLFLNSGYSYSDKMPFKDTYRMVPGYYMIISKNKFDQKRYSQMKFSRLPVKDIDAALDKYEELWTDAIRDFQAFNGTKNLGSALSGGLDTSWVVFMAAMTSKKPLHTYTCYYQYSLFNELKESSYVTKKINGIHHKIPVTENDLDLIPEMIDIAEEPVLSSSLSLFKMINTASSDVDTLLTGDGGNNIFHHLYPVSEIHRYIKDWPYLLRKLFFLFIDGLARLSGNERLWEARYPLHAFSYPDFYNNFYKNLTCYRHFDPMQRKKLFRPNVLKEFDEANMVGQIPIRKKTFNDDLVNARFTWGNMQYVTTFHEKFAKSKNMNVFPPYQNQALMDFICSLPYELLYKGNTLKRLTNRVYKMYFHKMALKRHFPSSFVDKVGQPFDQPFHGWFQRRPVIIELLIDSLKRRGWYNNAYLDELYLQHKKQKLSKKIFCQLHNHAYRLMALLALEIWCMEYMDGKSSGKIPLEQFLRK